MEKGEILVENPHPIYIYIYRVHVRFFRGVSRVSDPKQNTKMVHLQLIWQKTPRTFHGILLVSPLIYGEKKRPSESTNTTDFFGKLQQTKNAHPTPALDPKIPRSNFEHLPHQIGVLSLEKTRTAKGNTFLGTQIGCFVLEKEMEWTLGSSIIFVGGLQFFSLVRFHVFSGIFNHQIHPVDWGFFLGYTTIQVMAHHGTPTEI